MYTDTKLKMKRFKSQFLSPVQKILLVLYRAREPLSVPTILLITNLSPAAIYYNLKKLEIAGLVRSIKKKTGYVYVLTEKGKKAVLEMINEMREWIEEN